MVPVYRRIDRDLFNTLIEEGKEFWENHVQNDQRPPLESHLASSREVLSEITGEVAITSEEVYELKSEEDLYTLFDHHLKAKKEEKVWKETKDKLQATIMELLGDKYKKVTFGGKAAASWSKGRVTETVDKKLLKEKYPEIYEELVTSKTGKPIFGIRFKG